jgi:hypothetical protein
LRRGAVLVLLGGALLAGCGGGGSSATPTGLKLQREDLIATVRALSQASAEVRDEVAASKAAWGLVANDLPVRGPGGAGRRAIATATSSAARLRLPGLFEEGRARTLTGPSSALSAEFARFRTLCLRGWQQIEYAAQKIAGGPAEAARFARANVALYIDSVYDAHFGLAQIGKQLLAGYERLGGPAAFGSALSQAEVRQLAEEYSEARIRLRPHAGVKLGS